MQFTATADKAAAAGAGGIDYSDIARPKRDTRVQTAVSATIIIIIINNNNNNNNTNNND
jgi:hypothetical protein